MKTTAMKIPLLYLLALLFGAPTGIGAQVDIEIEADPIAYAFNGFSLHAAKIFGSVRANVGTFGIDVPGAYHGNDGWSSTMRGAGVKVDYLGSSLDGFFVGVEGGYMRNTYTLAAGGEAAERNIIGVGVRGGYRLPLGRSGLYVAPWLGVGYNFDGDDVEVSGEKFDRRPITVFPTVHLGWRF